MSRRAVAVGSNLVTINADDPPTPDLRTWAVLRTRVIDELTGDPPRVPLTLRSSSTGAHTGVAPRCTPRFAGDGICGFVARPRDMAYELLHAGAWTARIEAPGYLTHDLTPAIEHARRALNPGVVPPATLVQLAAPVPFDAEQFVRGRGVLVERNAANLTDEFGVVRAVSPAPPLGNVPLTAALLEAHAATRAVSGVPMLLPDRPLHRAVPVRIRGRVQRRLPGPGGTLVPAPGASIGIRGVWHTYPSTTSTAPIAIGFCAVAPPLYFDIDPGTNVDVTTLIPFGPPRALLDPVEQGARAVTIVPNNGLAPAGGDRVQIEDPTSPETEILVSDGFDPTLDPAAPVRMRLRTPTAYIHRAAAAARSVNVGPLVNAGTVTREAQAGDSVAFASNLAALVATTGTIVIGQGTPHEAWHTAMQPPTTPNDATFLFSAPVEPDGRFEWPAIARVAQLRVRALHVGYVPLQIDFALEYDGENALSIVFIN